MADESASDSRPISVSEILARSREANGESAVQPSREGRGRRRAGRDGAVSVSELTGEIPRVGDTGSLPVTAAGASSPTAPTTDRSSTPDQPPAADEASGRGSVRPHTPDVTPQAPAPRVPTAPQAPTTRPAPARPARPGADDSGRLPTFPRSDNPVPRRPAEDVASVDRWRTDAVAESGPDQSRPRFAVGRTASGMPGSAPMSRDFSAEAVARRMGTDRDPADDESANAVTGIIPIVGDRDDLVVIDTDDDLEAADLSGTPGGRRTGRFSEVIDNDFDAYRSFSDIEADDEPARPKRGLGRWLKGRKTAQPPAADDRDQHLPAAGGRPFAGLIEPDRRESTSPAATAPDAPEADARDLATPTSVVPAPADSTPAEPTTAEPTTAASSTAEPTTAEPATAASIPAVPTTAEPTPAGPAGRDRTAVGPFGSADTDPAQDADDAAARTAPEQSPVRAWAQVIGESVIGLAAGIGLFWGFTELWKWNVYFALVLAVVVIFGIVTLAHIVRRSRDLTTTLLAMGVGLIVTIGPLVLLAT